jgi:hypothetical protein
MVWGDEMSASDTPITDAATNELDYDTLLRLCRSQAVRLKEVERRYIWAANELLACDHGDNDSESIPGKSAVGWQVYGWRTSYGMRKIFGSSISEAIDQYLAEHIEILEAVDAAIAQERKGGGE